VRIVVSRVDEFPPGERRIVQAGRRSIGVFRVGDSFYAINNYCPHQGGPLCLGRTKPWVRSTGPGDYAMAEQEALVACPWHGWEYDLATGQSFLGPGEPPARTYEVSVETGGVDAAAGDAAPVATGTGPPTGGRRPGPFVAETFPVHVEDAYVVVDTSPRAQAAGKPGGER
jgi:nitrite reductase/ring-hydroxylating ferredoxin subunit